MSDLKRCKECEQFRKIRWNNKKGLCLRRQSNNNGLPPNDKDWKPASVSLDNKCFWFKRGGNE